MIDQFKKHLRATSKRIRPLLCVVVVVFRKLAVIERLAPLRLRTNAASVEGTTPTAGRLRAPLPEPQRNPVRVRGNVAFVRLSGVFHLRTQLIHHVLAQKSD